MSSYDSSGIKSSNTVNYEQVISELNSLATKLYQVNTTSALSSASTTWVTHGSQSVAVAANEVVVCQANLDFSISNGTSSTGRIALFRDSTIVNSYDYIISNSSSDTSGVIDSRCILAIDENQNGTFTYAIKFSRNSGAGTVYVGVSSLQIMKMKKQ